MKIGQRNFVYSNDSFPALSNNNHLILLSIYLKKTQSRICENKMK